jgi:hypothetical protein
MRRDVIVEAPKGSKPGTIKEVIIPSPVSGGIPIKKFYKVQNDGTMKKMSATDKYFNE